MSKILIAFCCVFLSLKSYANKYYSSKFEIYELCELDGYLSNGMKPILSAVVQEILKRHFEDRYEDNNVDCLDSSNEGSQYYLNEKIGRLTIDGLKSRFSKRLDINVRALPYIIANQVLNDLSVKVDQSSITMENL